MNYWLKISLCVLLLSCSESTKQKQPPKNLLEREELIDLIVDVQMIESYYHNRYQRPEVYVNALDSATYYVFKNHQTTKAVFKENLMYWAEQPDTLYSIYEAALDTVNNRINAK